MFDLELTSVFQVALRDSFRYLNHLEVNVFSLAEDFAVQCLFLVLTRLFFDFHWGLLAYLESQHAVWVHLASGFDSEYFVNPLTAGAGLIGRWAEVLF